MTELTGIRADRVSAFSWALSSLFAGLAGVLIARFNTLATADFFNLMVVAIAAAAVGRLVSLPGPSPAASGWGCSSPWPTPSCPAGRTTTAVLARVQENVTPAMPFIVLFGLLVLWPALRTARAGRPALGRRPTPPSLAALSTAAGP